jgi:hypothetical protein
MPTQQPICHSLLQASRLPGSAFPCCLMEFGSCQAGSQSNVPRRFVNGLLSPLLLLHCPLPTSDTRALEAIHGRPPMIKTAHENTAAKFQHLGDAASGRHWGILCCWKPQRDALSGWETWATEHQASFDGPDSEGWPGPRFAQRVFRRDVMLPCGAVRGEAERYRSDKFVASVIADEPVTCKSRSMPLLT